jgi:hypothetical protein
MTGCRWLVRHQATEISPDGAIYVSDGCSPLLFGRCSSGTPYSTICINLSAGMKAKLSLTATHKLFRWNKIIIFE